MTTSANATTWHDEPALHVVGGGLTAIVVPGRGGKIVSLRDGTGREWLAAPAAVLPPPARGTTSFVDAEMCGWDDCVPTVDADVLDGVALPDHGEAWTTPWTTNDDDAWGYDGQVLPYRFARGIAPTPTGLRLSYRAEAVGPTAIPFQWAAHPQFVAGPGAQLVLPAHVRHVDGIYGVDGRQPWTDELARVDRVVDGDALKFWVAPEAPASWAGLRTADGAMLALSWDPVAVPYLALWVDAGMHSRERIVALEPSTGACEALSASRVGSRCAWLEPGRPLSWSVDLEVTRAT